MNDEYRGGPRNRPARGNDPARRRRPRRRPIAGPQGAPPPAAAPESEPIDRGQAGAINRSRPIYGESRDRRRSPNGAPMRPDRLRRAAQAPRPAELVDEPPPLPADPREAALKILHAVETRSAFSDKMLEAAHARGTADPRDQGLLHELAKGALRWRGRLDYHLDPIVHVGLAQLQPWIRNILRLGAYQILFLDRIPPHAAVDESVKLANHYGHPGAAGLVNSVLRRLSEAKESLVPPEGDDVESLAAWGSHPRWLVQRWSERFGVEGVRALMLANNRHVAVGLRVNPLRLTRQELIERLAAEGVKAESATFAPDLVWSDPHRSPSALAAFRDGLCTVQDESEALVARLVAPQPHERLLDLCAAPGGKSTHLAALMNDEGEVWAMERLESRIPSLEATVQRMGIHSVHVVQGDGRTYVFPMPFDRVLVDAPCSGLGVLGRRADARWRKGPEILRELPPIQLELLAAAGRRVRPGGVLVYSVCSFEPEETEIVVERFLHRNPAFILESVQGLLPDPVVDEHGFMRTLPHVHGCDGAFAARFRRT